MALNDREGTPLLADKFIVKHGPKRLSNSVNASRYRYDESGKSTFVRRGKARPAVFPDVVRDVKAKQEAAAKLGKPAANDSRAFDISRLRPLAGYTLLRYGAEITRDGAVLIPEKHRKKSDVHLVIAIGKGSTVHKVGDWVQLDRAAGARAVHFEDAHYFITPSHAIAVICDGPDSDCKDSPQPSSDQQ